MTKATKHKAKEETIEKFELSDDVLISFTKEMFDDTGIREKVIFHDKGAIEYHWNKWFFKEDENIEESKKEAYVMEAISFFQKLNAYDFSNDYVEGQSWFNSDYHTYADVISAMCSLANDLMESDEKLMKKYQPLTTAMMISLNTY